MDNFGDHEDGYGDDMNYGNQLGENNIRLPIIDHIEKLDAIIDAIGEETMGARNDITQCRIDLANLERMDKDNSMGYTKFLLDETARIEREFAQLTNVEGSESGFLKMQVQQLNQEKFKINQNVAVLDERVRETEHDVGFKFYLE